MENETYPPFVLHDESVNSYGFWMMTAGADLSQFKKNPIMLWNHNRSWRDTKDTLLPIGHWDNVRKEGDKILADPVFDADEFAQTIASKVLAGTLRMASAGVKVLATSNEAKHIKPGQRYETVTKWRMREASIVDIGSNDNALALYDDNGVIITLSDEGAIPLKELSTTNTNEHMDKLTELKKILNLNEGAGEQEIIAVIQPILVENKTLKETLKAIEDKEKQAKQDKAKSLVAEAIKDGRLQEKEDKSVSKAWLDLFEKDYDTALSTLEGLPKRDPIHGTLGDTTPKKSAWELRQDEIAKNSKNAR